jgi:hypothetical protein
MEDRASAAIVADLTEFVAHLRKPLRRKAR